MRVRFAALVVVLLAAGSNMPLPAAQALGTQNAPKLPPLSYICPMAEHADGFNDYSKTGGSAVADLKGAYAGSR
jgi:hypothetical protein